MRSDLLCSVALALFAMGAKAQITTSQPVAACSGVALGRNGALNGFIPSPNDAWHQNIQNAPVDPLSNKIVTTEVQAASLHPDFANPNTYNAGIPYTVVDSSTQPMVPIAVRSGQSDTSVQPLPATMAVEGNPAACQSSPTGDQHAILFDRNTCVVYETYQASFCPTASPQWSGTQTTIWDFTKTEQRPLGWTSADAAGLSVFEGLVRYDEIVAGAINHAIRFTLEQTKNDGNGGYFIPPASHASGSLWGSDNVIGMRLRLRADYNISTFSKTNQIILTAMQQYGLILADNGGSGYFQGTPDPGWNNDDLAALEAVPLSAFEVVDAPGNSQLSTTYSPGVAPLYPNGDIMDANSIPFGAVPSNSLSASVYSITVGESVILTPISSGESYNYIDNAGFVRGPISVSPTETTTYTLFSNNEFGSTASTPVTITVNAAPVAKAPHLSFVPIAIQTLGSAPFTVSAESDSDGALTFESISSSTATMSGQTVNLRAPGQVTLIVHQAASGSYRSGDAKVTFQVVDAQPTIRFSVTHRSFPGVVRLDARSNSDGVITYSVVSGPAVVTDGRYLTLTGAGEVTVMASQSAARYFTAGSLTVSFRVSGY